MRDKNRSAPSRPGREDFQAYIRGELSKEKKEAIESFLEENPMALDAMEGLKWVDKPQKVSKHIKRIQRKTQDRLRSRMTQESSISKRAFRVRPEIQYKPFMASMAGLAAVVLIFLVIMWIPSEPKEKIADTSKMQVPNRDIPEASKELDNLAPLAENTLEAPGGLTPQISTFRTEDTDLARQKKNMTAKEMLPTKNKSRNQPEGPKLFLPPFKVTEGGEWEEEHDLRLKEQALGRLAQAPLSSQVFLPYSSGETSSPFDLPHMSTITNLDPRDQVDEERPASPTAIKKRKGQASPAYKSRQMLSAPPSRLEQEEDVQRSLKANLGIWYFTYKMYEDAERELFHLLSYKPEEPHQGDWAASSSAWYLSRIYMATGRTQEAKGLLQQIASYPNPYRNQAQFTLRKL